MILKTAQSSDAKELFALEQTLFSEANYPLSYSSFRYHIKNSLLYLAVIDEKIAGYILVLIKRKDAKIYSLGVDSRYRSMGISSKLLQVALHEIKNRGFKKIMLEVRSDNEKALALYKKFEFKIEKKETAFYRDGCDAFIMALDL